MMRSALEKCVKAKFNALRFCCCRTCIALLASAYTTAACKITKYCRFFNFLKEKPHVFFFLCMSTHTHIHIHMCKFILMSSYAALPPQKCNFQQTGFCCFAALSTHLRMQPWQLHFMCKSAPITLTIGNLFYTMQSGGNIWRLQQQHTGNSIKENTHQTHYSKCWLRSAPKSVAKKKK